MAAKVFDAYGDLHVNTKGAEKNIKKARDAIDRMNERISVFGDSMTHADRMSASLSRRLKAGFNTGLEASMRRGEGGVLALANALEVAGSGFKKTDNESVLALRAFQKFQRRSYSLQSTLGVLAGTIGDLSGGFLSLVGVLGQAAFAFVGVGTALMGVVAGFIVARVAMGGVGKALGQLWNGQNQYNKALRDAKKDLRDLRFELEGAVLSEKEAAIELEKARTQLAMAQDLPPDNMVRREAELAYQQADLNYRRAKDKVKDLQDTIKRGGDQQAKLAAANPFNNMTKSQIAFTKFLLTLKPQIQALKEAASSSFLPPLQTAIETIVSKTFPTLEQGFKQLGSAMGYASIQFANTFNKPENVKALQDFFTDSEPRIRQLGDASQKFLGGFLNLMSASKPLTDRFIIWIDSVASRFEVMTKNASLTKFLDLAGYVASQIGNVFGGFSDGIGNIMEANFPSGGGGAGQVLLDWLNGIAQGFKDFTGAEGFSKWLKDTTTNATVALGVIGDFLHIFIDLSGRPEIKQFWEILGKAIPDLTKILMDGIKAAPAFGELIVSMMKLLALFSDSGALESFFGTLKIIVDTVVNLLAPFKPLIDLIGRFHGVILAVGLGIIAFKMAGMIFMAILGRMFAIIGQIVGGFMAVAKAGTRFNTVLATSERPMGKWGRSMTNFIRGMGNANTIMNKNASNYFSLIGKEKEYAALLASKPTRLQKATGALKIYREAMREATTSTKLKTTAVKNETATDTASGTADKKKLTGLKLIKSSYRDIVSSVKEYNSVMKMKTATDIANNAAAKEGLATANATTDSLKKRNLINRMGGAGTGAGRTYSGPGAMGAVGVGLAAQGLIAGAAGGGMTAGSAMTALGGAAMFVPGGMIPGLALGIVGSIVQGFEAAAQAAREKQQEIVANKVQITAQSVYNTSAQVGDETAKLMATGKYTLSEATAEVQKRRAASNEIAVGSSANQTTLDQVRLAFQDAGIKADSPKMTKLLQAAANYASYNMTASADSISSSILGVLNTKGMSGVDTAFAKVLDSSGNALKVQDQNIDDVDVVREVTNEQLTNNQVSAIVKLVTDPKNFSIKGTGALRGKNFFNSQLLSGFTDEAIEIAMNTAKGKKLDDDTKKILRGAVEGTTTKFLKGTGYETRTRADGTKYAAQVPMYQEIAAPSLTGGANLQGLYNGGSYNFNTGSISRSATGMFSSKDILPGSVRNPSTVSLLPSSVELTSLSKTANNSARTAEALELLAGMKSPDGKFLQIVDVNAKDKVAPKIVIPDGLTPGQQKQYELLNLALEAAWKN